MNGFIKLYAVLSAFEATITERREAKGITAIEYALMAAGLATIIAAALVVLGTRVSGLFGEI